MSRRCRRPKVVQRFGSRAEFGADRTNPGPLVPSPPTSSSTIKTRSRKAGDVGETLTSTRWTCSLSVPSGVLERDLRVFRSVPCTQFPLDTRYPGVSVDLGMGGSRRDLSTSRSSLVVDPDPSPWEVERRVSSGRRGRGRDPQSVRTTCTRLLPIYCVQKEPEGSTSPEGLVPSHPVRHGSEDVCNRPDPLYVVMVGPQGREGRN